MSFAADDWLPMPPQQGPPLPRSLGIYWPWFKKDYCCPYGDQICFATLAELQEHVKNVHPGERIPIDVIWD